MSKRSLVLLLLGVWLGAGGVAHAALTASPDPLDLGSVAVGQSATKSATLRANPEVANVTVALAPDGDCAQFEITAPTAAVTVGPGNDQTVTIKFTPTSPGDKTCKVSATGTTDQVSFMAKGHGTAPQIDVSPVSLSFTNIDVGATSGPQTVTATNIGERDLAISSATLTTGSADYTLNGVSSATLPPGGKVSWDIACKPSKFGTLTGTFSIVSNSFAQKTFDVPLSCTANQGILTVNPTSINFGGVSRGATQSMTFTLKNTGNVAVAGITGTLSKTLVGYAFDTATVPGTLAAGETSTPLTVSFTPQKNTDGGAATIAFSGTWGSARSTPPAALSLDGQEVSFQVRPQPTLDFGSFRFDSHTPQTFQVVNDGSAPVMITTTFVADLGTATGEFAFSYTKGSTAVTPPVSLAASEQLDVTVTPQVDARTGQVSGHVDVASTGGGSLRLNLTGTATAAEVMNPAVIDFGIVDIQGPPPTQSITLKNTGDGTLDVRSLAVEGSGPGGSPNPAFDIALPSAPSQLAPGETLDIPVTYRPTVASGSDQPDRAILTAQLGGSLAAMAMVTITGQAVFSEAHGSGGCDAGGRGPGAGLVLGLAMLGALRRRRRTRGGRAIPAALATLALALAPAARADGIGIAVFEPTPATTGAGFALQPADVGADGSWVGSAIVSYASNPLVLDSLRGDGGRATTSALVERSTLMQLGVAYALLDRLELGAHLPLYQQSGEAGATAKPAKGTALGNLALHAKLRLVRAGTGLGTLVVGASAIGVVPTASKGQFTGSDQPEGRFLLLGSFTPAVMSSRLSISVNGGPVLRGKSEYANIVEQSGLLWGVGASFRIADQLWATGELFGESTPSGERRQPTGAVMPPPAVTLSSVEGLAGLTIKPDRRFTIGLAVGRGVTDAVGTPELRGVVSLAFVPGALAIAPIHALVPARPDGDADGDGIPDSVDRCPNEPEDKDLFEDSDGCPDPDNDRDGIPDAVDKCPLDAEDKDGFQDDDGCPDKDNDGDGIPDAIDKCPNQAEDKDGFQDLDGCPDPDNDADGIPDAVDRCPNQPETINGIQDDDGCPDKGDSTIILSPDRIETLDPIQFTGVKLTRTSYPLLGQVAATLRAHSEIIRLRVTVHVQPTSDADADQARSEKRAQAVREWLVQWGIAPSRIEARGFGGSKPLVPPGQRGAAKINDRLELIILERK